MDRDILDLLDEDKPYEPCTKPLSIPVPDSFKSRWTRVGELTKQVYGKNQLNRLSRKALLDLVDMVESAATEKLRAKKESA